MFCQFCGKEMPDGADVCSNCGRIVKREERKPFRFDIICDIFSFLCSGLAIMFLFFINANIDVFYILSIIFIALGMAFYAGSLALKSRLITRR